MIYRSVGQNTVPARMDINSKIGKNNKTIRRKKAQKAQRKMRCPSGKGHSTDRVNQNKRDSIALKQQYNKLNSILWRLKIEVGYISESADENKFSRNPQIILNNK